MAAGGIYDHLAGGFARYSTDRHWLVPHFEKMLTDQALLARAYLHAWQVDGPPDYLQVVTETLDYVLADLAAPGGGLCSSEDADAGGVEGSHATFTPAQAAEALAAAGREDLLPAVLDWYGITEGGNWEGTTVLRRPLGAPLARPEPVEAGRRLLLDARGGGRSRPATTRSSPSGTPWRRRCWPKRPGPPATSTGPPGPRRSPTSSSPSCAGPTGAGSVRWQAGPDTGLRRRLRLGGRVLHPPGRADRGRAVDGAGGRGGRRPARAVLGLRARRRSSPPGTTPSSWWSGRKDLFDGATPSANSVAAGALLRLAALTGQDRYRIGRRAHRRAGGTAPGRAADGHRRPGGRRRPGRGGHRGGGGR